MAWPMAWDAILADLEAAQANDLNLPVAARGTFVRVLNRARRETVRNEGSFNFRASLSEKPTRIRGFTNAPYEEGELSAGYSWSNNWLSVDVQATGAMAEVVSDLDQVQGDTPEAATARFTLAVLTGVVMLGLGLARMGWIVRWVPPFPGRIPRRTSERPKLACSAAIRMSVARSRVIPPARQ